MTFSRDDRPSVSIMMKNNGKMMDFDRFMYTQSKSGVRQNPIRKLSNFGRNWVHLLVELPVDLPQLGYHNGERVFPSELATIFGTSLLSRWTTTVKAR